MLSSQSWSTVNEIFNKVCYVIWNALFDYVTPPSNSRDLIEMFADFEQIWNMLHCIEAIDGKHITMKKPTFSGSLWHNYKGFFSIVLIAICDSRYNFIAIDIRQYGSNNDSAILLNSKMRETFEKDSFHVLVPFTFMRLA